MVEIQKRHPDWEWQWKNYQDHERWLFYDWIWPVTLEDFRGQRVLDAGCGGGQHLSFIAPYAREVVGVDLNTTGVAAERIRQFNNVRLVEGDLAQINFPEKFDLVYCIGVIHHTDSPEATFKNLAAQTRFGGRTIIWCYSHEGNFLNRIFVEGAKSLFFYHLPKSAVRLVSKILTALIYLPIYTIYLLPLRFLPYYEYFQNFRKLSFARNELNVFDKLNAPQTHFIKRERIEAWFKDNGYTEVIITPYRGVSWRGVGIKV